MSDRLTKLDPLPCPFCGVAITVIEGDEDSHDAWNHPEGPADGPECYLLGWELAYGDGDHERWNQRADAALRARHEKLLNVPRWVRRNIGPEFEHPNGDWVRYADIRAALEDE